MKNSTKSNMYESGPQETREIFDDYLQGHHIAAALVISSKPLSAPAQTALESSFDRLGYQKDFCLFASLSGFTGTEIDDLNETSLLALIEGIDPLFLVIADEQAADHCSAAYHHTIPLNERSRLLGREVRAFASFEDMLETSPGKQKAWGLLKTLPKLTD